MTRIDLCIWIHFEIRLASSPWNLYYPKWKYIGVRSIEQKQDASIKLLWLAFAGTLNLLTHFTASLHHMYTIVIVYIIHPIFMWGNYYLLLLNKLNREPLSAKVLVQQTRTNLESLVYRHTSDCIHLWHSAVVLASVMRRRSGCWCWCMFTGRTVTVAEYIWRAGWITLNHC